MKTLLLAALLSISAFGQKPVGVIYQDANGKQTVKPLGRGMFYDPANDSVRTLSWGGLYDTRPFILWMTTTGGNAQPVRVDSTILSLIDDPSTPGGKLLTINTTAIIAAVVQKLPLGEGLSVDALGKIEIDDSVYMAEFRGEHPANIGNNTFLLSRTPEPSTVEVFLNGIHQDVGVDYTLTGSNIQFINPISATPQVSVNYGNKKVVP